MSSIAIDTEMPLHEETRCEVGAAPADVFEHIDRPERLSAHMARKSWRLGGASMSIETDAAGGRAVGSHFRLGGRMMGLSLSVECVVVQRAPPRFKAWETLGRPRLLVIGPYRMSVTIEPRNGASNVSIGIDYALPANRFWRSFGPFYAHWCVRQMAHDIVRRFGAIG
jgi:Polyketide cyclase / dehydrase and lipid transport